MHKDLKIPRSTPGFKRYYKTAPGFKRHYKQHQDLYENEWRIHPSHMSYSSGKFLLMTFFNLILYPLMFIT